MGRDVKLPCLILNKPNREKQKHPVITLEDVEGVRKVAVLKDENKLPIFQIQPLEDIVRDPTYFNFTKKIIAS